MWPPGVAVGGAVHADLANGVYRAVITYRRGDSITPRHFADLSMEVASILG